MAGTCSCGKQEIHARGLCSSCYQKWNRNRKPRKPTNRPGYHRELRYGLKQEDYLRMLSGQNNRCAICKEEKRLNVDHDHKTGAVRALLCHGCNTAVAFVELKGVAALEYLRRFNSV